MQHGRLMCCEKLEVALWVVAREGEVAEGTAAAERGIGKKQQSHRNSLLLFFNSRVLKLPINACKMQIAIVNKGAMVCCEARSHDTATAAAVYCRARRRTL